MSKRLARLSICSMLTGFLCLVSAPLLAEPYLAVQSGQKCGACHVSPSGGGMRNEFGQAYGLTLAGHSQNEAVIDSRISDRFSIGGNLRTTLRATDTEQQSSQRQFETERLSLYLRGKLIPERLEFYLDQQFAPASDNRAAWISYRGEQMPGYVRVGKFFLPYGLRLEDDRAFIRQVSGINFSSADNGVEVGWDPGQWSLQGALSNGTAGASEVNRDKQLSLRAVYVTPSWRMGGSYNNNQGVTEERSMINVFGGVLYFGAQWLFEFDRIEDRGDNDITQKVLFAEMNRRLKPGHVLKLTHEFHDPNIAVDEDERTRNSVVWEYTPIHYLQLRSALRRSEGIPQKPQDNSDEVFVSLHAWF